MNMKKILMGTLLLLNLGPVVGASAFAAEQDSKKTDATFEIVTNPNGTIMVEANSLLFGPQTISPRVVNAKAQNDLNIKVTEFSGWKPGWTLQVQMSKFMDGTSEAKDIKLFYPNVVPTTTTGGNANQHSPISEGKDKSFFDENVKGTIVEDNNIPVTLAGAKVGNGFGEWTFTYSTAADTNVQLRIPTGQVVGSYKSTVTYTVRDTPVL